MINTVKTRVIEIINSLRARIDRHENYIACFETPAGQKVLEDLSKNCNLCGTTFVAGDPHSSAFKEGQRSVVVYICKQIGKDTTELIKQIEEQSS